MSQHLRRSTTISLAPGPPNAELFLRFREIEREGQLHFFVENWRRHGDIFRFRVGASVAHVLAHPDQVEYVLARNQANYVKGLGYARLKDLLGLGLLTNEAEAWRQQRRAIQPWFTRSAVTKFASATQDATGALLSDWSTRTRHNETIELHTEMLRLALSLIVRIIFGAKSGERRFDDEILRAYSVATEYLNEHVAAFSLTSPLAPTQERQSFEEAVRALDELVLKLIEDSRSQPSATDSVLSLLLRAETPMSEQQIRDEVITLLFAGHETSAAALTWMWLLLAQHHQVAAKLYAELARELDGRMPTVTDFPRLEYTRRVVAETLRLYPPVWTFPRAAKEEDEISGYRIPAGSLVYPAPFLSHRHSHFWDEPETFNPERPPPRHPFAYYPFGGGLRTCLGVHLALQELCLVVATIAQRYRLRPVVSSAVEPKSVITLHPAQAIFIRLESRGEEYLGNG